jgi:hypothetical protein
MGWLLGTALIIDLPFAVASIFQFANSMMTQPVQQQPGIKVRLIGDRNCKYGSFGAPCKRETKQCEQSTGLCTAFFNCSFFVVCLTTQQLKTTERRIAGQN